MLELIITSVAIAIVSYTWVNFIVSPDDVLDFLPNWYWSIIPYKFHNHNLVLKLYKVLFQCEKCNGGQLALWYAIIFKWNAGLLVNIFFVFFTIFILGISKKL